jgi:hypothetical protein
MKGRHRLTVDNHGVLTSQFFQRFYKGLGRLGAFSLSNKQTKDSWRRGHGEHFRPANAFFGEAAHSSPHGHDFVTVL